MAYPNARRRAASPICDAGDSGIAINTTNRHAHCMPMRVSTVRFSEEHWKLLEREALREGVSAAQFIRDATITRAAYAMGQRGDEGFEEALGRARPGADAETPEKGARRRQALLDAAAAQRTPTDSQPCTQPDCSTPMTRRRSIASPGSRRRCSTRPSRWSRSMDADRQFFKSCLGMPEPWASQRGTPLSHSFCQHAVA